MPENESNLLHTLCGLPEEAELPEKLVEIYWRYKQLQCRVGHSGLNLDALVLIGFLAGIGQKLPGDDPPSGLFAMFQGGEVKRGDKITVKWRNGEEEVALVNVTGPDEMIVQRVSESEVRRMPTSKFLGVACEVA
jgi:hypothetical protein